MSVAIITAEKANEITERAITQVLVDNALAHIDKAVEIAADQGKFALRYYDAHPLPERTKKILTEKLGEFGYKVKVAQNGGLFISWEHYEI